MVFPWPSHCLYTHKLWAGNELGPVDGRYFCSCFISLIEVHVWTSSCHSAILLYLLPTCHLFYFTLHLLTFLLFSCLLSRLWGAKQLLAFLLSFVCKVFGFGLPLLFSWEMAEAVFREGFGRFDGGKYLRLFLNETFLLSLSNIWINQASLTFTSYKQYRHLKCSSKCARQLWS